MSNPNRREAQKSFNDDDLSEYDQLGDCLTRDQLMSAREADGSHELRALKSNKVEKLG